MRTEFGFPRTVCACGDCTINCRFLPGMLIPADLERIARHVGAANLVAFADKHLLASPGALVIDNGAEMRIPTLVPARNVAGGCKFLSPTGSCTIHQVSPFGCAFFDAHQERDESDWRSTHGLRAIQDDWKANGIYAGLWVRLEGMGRVAPDPQVARAAMRAETERLRPEVTYVG